jgi:hypothetical protein
VLIAVIIRGRVFHHAALPAIFAVLIFLGFVVGSLAGAYPFGGELRQQFFCFPFLILALAGALDSLTTNRTVVAALAIVMIIHATVWYRSFPIERDELFTAEYRAFRTDFGADGNVVVDQFSLIALFIHTNDRRWTLARHHTVDRLDEYVIAPGLRVFRDRATWNYDLARLPAFIRLRQVARASGVETMTLFSLRQFPPGSMTPVQYLERARVNARTAGLTPMRLVGNTYSVFARLRTSVAPPRSAAPHRFHPLDFIR